MQSKGFTLLELLIVVAIIGIIAAVIIGGISGGSKRDRVQKTWMEECVKEEKKKGLSQKRAEDICEMKWETEVLPRMND